MAQAVPSGLSKKFVKRRPCILVVPSGFEMQRISTQAIWHKLCHRDCQESLSKEDHVIAAVPSGFEMQRIATQAIWHKLCHRVCQKKFVKRRPCNGRCAFGIRDAENLNTSYMAQAVPSGLSKKCLSKEDHVIVALPSGFEMQRISTQAIWHKLCHRDCQESLSKENHVIAAVPSGCEMQRISTQAIYGTSCAIGIVKKVCQKKTM